MQGWWKRHTGLILKKERGIKNNKIAPGFEDKKDRSLIIRLQKIDDVHGCLVVHLTGCIDTHNYYSYQYRIGKAIKVSFVRLIFNLAKYNEASDWGIGSFSAFLKAMRPLGGDLVLLEVPPKVYEVYQRLGFFQFLNIKDNLEKAVAFFSHGGGAMQIRPFPKIFQCPTCIDKILVVRPGYLCCSKCETIVEIDNRGQILMC